MRFIVPWFIVSIIDWFAWPLGYQTYVAAVGGAGWHRGRLGADSVHFVKRRVDGPRFKRMHSLRIR
jgi:hypothetical protein